MNKQQKGGIRVLAHYNFHTAFHHFLNNSTIQLKSTNSKTCFVYELKLNEGIETPYESIRSNAFFSSDENLKKIRKLIIKVAIINDNAKEQDIKWGGQHVYMTIDEFKIEIKNQTNIFNTTLRELEPCCPSIVFADVFTMDIIADIFNNMMGIGIKQNSRVGIIAMELADGYKDLYLVQSKKEYEMLAIYELCRFASYGFLHRDPHGKNIMINGTYEYVSDFNGRALLIDFGDVKEIEPIPIMNNAELVIKTLLDDDLWDDPDPDTGISFNRTWISYAWLLQYENPSTTEFVNRLHESRQEKIKEFYERTGTTSSDVDTFLHGSNIFTLSGGKKKRKIKGKRTKKGGRVEMMRETSYIRPLGKQHQTRKQRPLSIESTKFEELVNYLQQEKAHGDLIKKHTKRFTKNYVSLQKL
jgi:hypothetical protein